MWMIAKINKNQSNLFAAELKKKFTNVSIYYPKILYRKKIKNILGDYLFFYCDNLNILNSNIKYLKGLKHFLPDFSSNQSDIKTFIKYCKLHEDSRGFLKNSFFKERLSKSGIFIDGPFSNFIFDVISKEKKYVSVLIDNCVIKISDKCRVLYQNI